MKKYFSDKNFMAGFIFFFVSLFYLGNSFLIQTKGVVSIEADFMPKIYGVMLLICSSVLLITSFLKVRTRTKKENTVTDWKRIFAVLVLIFIYVLLMEYIGFVLISILFLFCLSLLLTPDYVKKNYWVYIFFSIILPIIAYFIFSHYLSLTMPSGIFL
ncbi:tripartite tricarboxylate transporter TctB family protein [Pasteurellaceae bacterium LIM206]|nr:tripartite tricarboxylate transporter TctB family protein [Pasteurellaceae bacterium LIM206]